MTNKELMDLSVWLVLNRIHHFPSIHPCRACHSFPTNIPVTFTVTPFLSLRYVFTFYLPPHTSSFLVTIPTHTLPPAVHSLFQNPDIFISSPCLLLRPATAAGRPGGVDVGAGGASGGTAGLRGVSLHRPQPLGGNLAHPHTQSPHTPTPAPQSHGKYFPFLFIYIFFYDYLFLFSPCPFLFNFHFYL